MSEDEQFVSRWSRLKREAGRTSKGTDAPPATPETPSPSDAGDARRRAPVGQPSDTEAPAFDLASLPSIDEIVAGTDIRAFLQSGVPAELTKAALRKAWSADPAIRNFIEMAENQWDFTDPSSIPGFGPLEAGDNIAELVSQAMGKLPQAVEETPPASPVAAAASEPAVGTPSTTAVSATPQASGIPERNEVPPDGEREERALATDVAAVQHGDSMPAPGNRLHRRAHGGALPK